MNDKAVALLEQYDIEVIRTRKGRGAYLCDTTQGVLIFKEYAGNEARLQLQDSLQKHIQKQNKVNVDSLVQTKSGELLVKDREGVSYILKTYYEGRECNIYDKEECLLAMRLLAKLHGSMEGPDVAPQSDAITSGEEAEKSGSMQNNALLEYEKHNKELTRIHNYLRKKKQKQVFERELYHVMGQYMEQAHQVTENWRQYVQDLGLTEPTDTYYHGNYQYHNIIYYENDWYIINFEKCQQGSPVRDVYLLLRKLLEKSDWQISLGKELLDAYKQLRPLSARESIDLYYRLAYPEKFWKIVNFYYNSPKAWLPQRNMEKLQKLLEQEQSRQALLEEYRRGLFWRT